MQIYPFSQLRNKGFSLFQSCFYKSGMLPEATLDSAVDCLLTHLPIEMKGSYTLRDLFEILLRSASRGDSIEHTVRSLAGAQSGNGIRYLSDGVKSL